MNTDRWRMVLLILLGAGLFAVASALRSPQAEVRAQDVAPPPAEIGRYQIAAYAGPPTEEGVSHGCYVIDTATGKVWHTRVGAGVVQVTKRTISTTP